MTADAAILPPAAAAFDAVAPTFDARFGEWQSVAAQRRVVRAALVRAFRPGARVLEIGGGTGVDAEWLIAQGRSVLMTDVSPAMVEVARARLGQDAVEQAAAEHLDPLVDRGETFDGAYSNFAALNCVTDLAPFAQGLARLVRPGGEALLVVFGRLCVGEVVTEGARGRFANMFRRLSRGNVPARVGGHDFTVRYHGRAALAGAMQPWFDLADSQAVGLFVPPSAAEPWISRHPRLLGAFEAIDRVASRPLAMFGDHILYRFVRTAVA